MYENLKELCREKGTTITALCVLVTGNKGNLSTWKKGYMRSDWLKECSDILGVTTDYLLTGKEEIANPTDLSEDKLRLLNYYDLMTEREQGEFISDAKNLTKGRDEEFIQDVG